MATDRIEVYVGTHGSPFADGSKGYPVDSLNSAMKIVRQRRSYAGQQAVVWVMPGEYCQLETLNLKQSDSFTTFTALDDSSHPVIKGSIEVVNWRTETRNGVEMLASTLGTPQARCLYVNNQRAPRPRFPRGGLLRVREQIGLDPGASFEGTLLQGSDRFFFEKESFPVLTRPEDIEVVVPHYWVQERMPVKEVDYARGEIVSTRRSIFALRDDAAEKFAQYYLENTVQTLGEVPGEWYFETSDIHDPDDPPTSVLLYVPHPGQTASSVRAELPVLDVFINADGNESEPIKEIRFEGITFSQCDFSTPPAAKAPFGVREDPMLDWELDYAADAQASSSIPGAIQFTYARACAIVDCRIEKTGGYGVVLGQGSRGNLISGVEFLDLGAGAVRSGGAEQATSPSFNSANEVSDCLISHGGRVYPNCVAILFQHGSKNVIAHNEISDFFYTGISVGWTWDYKDSPSTNNLIQSNHIYNLGQGVLNDMGGIYLLGPAPGTIVRGNHIHDVQCANYGGWGIYLDEGSSHVVVEHNIVHDVSSHAFHQHYGKEVIVRHNIFAFGGQGQVSITRPERHIAFSFERNLVIGEGTPGYSGTVGSRGVENYVLISDLNLFWDYQPQPEAIRAADIKKEIPGGVETGRSRFEGQDRVWAQMGYDTHSINQDPEFIDVAQRLFELGTDSPALAVGYQPGNIQKQAGPRLRAQRQNPLSYRTIKDQFGFTQAVSTV